MVQKSLQEFTVGLPNFGHLNLNILFLKDGFSSGNIEKKIWKYLKMGIKLFKES